MARKTSYDQQTKTTNRGRVANTYTEGNTVRVATPYERPEYEREESRVLTRREDQEAQRKNLRIRKNREKALQMNPGFLLFVALASVCVLMISVNYLKVQASIVTTMGAIEDLELDLEQIKADNDLLERQIQTYGDLDHIYEVAMTELGMVRPEADQVLYYEKTESEYVRQYESIP